MNYKDIIKVEKEKIKRKSKVVKQCVNCGNYKDLLNKIEWLKNELD